MREGGEGVGVWGVIECFYGVYRVIIGSSGGLELSLETLIYLEMRAVIYLAGRKNKGVAGIIIRE